MSVIKEGILQAKEISKTYHTGNLDYYFRWTDTVILHSNNIVYSSYS